MTRKKAALGFILVTLFLDILGIGLALPLMVDLVKGLMEGDTSRAQRTVGELSAAYAIMQFLFSPLLGSLSDRLGRRPVLLVSTFGAAASYALLAWAPSLAWLLVGRLLAGFTGASIGTATAYIADVTPPERRAQSFGLIGVMFGLGFIAGPALGVALGGFSVRAPFLLAGLLALVNGLFGLFVLPESLSPEQRRPFSWRRANPIGAFHALALNPTVLGLAVAFFFLGLAQRGLENVWMGHAEHRYAWTRGQAGISLVLVGLMAAIVQGGLVRRIIPALGERRTLHWSVIVGFISFVLYGFASRGWMLYAIIPLNALAGLAGPAMLSLLTRATPASEQGLLQGGLGSVRSLTDILGPLAASYLFSAFTRPEAPVQLPGSPFLLGALFQLVCLGVALVADAQESRRLITVGPPTGSAVRVEPLAKAPPPAV